MTDEFTIPRPRGTCWCMASGTFVLFFFLPVCELKRKLWRTSLHPDLFCLHVKDFRDCTRSGGVFRPQGYFWAPKAKNGLKSNAAWFSKRYNERFWNEALRKYLFRSKQRQHEHRLCSKSAWNFGWNNVELFQTRRALLTIKACSYEKRATALCLECHFLTNGDVMVFLARRWEFWGERTWKLSHAKRSPAAKWKMKSEKWKIKVTSHRKNF